MCKKVLFFEGAGCENTCHNGEFTNCRIRTAFTNDEGKKIYLELLSRVITADDVKHVKKYPDSIYKGFAVGETIGFIDSCHYITDDADIDDCNNSVLVSRRNAPVIRYTKKDVLSFLKEYCNATFDDVQDLDWMAGYRVFSDNGKRGTFSYYNFSEDFQYNEKLDHARNVKRKELETYYKELFHSKYSVVSVYVERGDLVCRLNVSDKQMQEAGFSENERKFIVPISAMEVQPC